MYHDHNHIIFLIYMYIYEYRLSNFWHLSIKIICVCVHLKIQHYFLLFSIGESYHSNFHQKLDFFHAPKNLIFNGFLLRTSFCFQLKKNHSKVSVEQQFLCLTHIGSVILLMFQVLI